MERKIINCPNCGKIIPSYVLNGTQFRTFQCAPSAVAEGHSRMVLDTLAQEKFSATYAVNADTGFHKQLKIFLIVVVRGGFEPSNKLMISLAKLPFLCSYLIGR